MSYLLLDRRQALPRDGIARIERQFPRRPRLALCILRLSCLEPGALFDRIGVLEGGNWFP